MASDLECVGGPKDGEMTGGMLYVGLDGEYRYEVWGKGSDVTFRGYVWHPFDEAEQGNTPRDETEGWR